MKKYKKESLQERGRMKYTIKEKRRFSNTMWCGGPWTGVQT
jgi:hypothetical protein